MIKLVIFDVDGVLIDTKSLHVDCLNKALSEYSHDYTISKEDEFKFNAIPTREKLKILSQERGLPENLHKEISELKQKYTSENLYKYVEKDVLENVRRIANLLKASGIKIALASNARKSFVDKIVEIYRIPVDIAISNESVTKTKPNPQMHFRCMEYCEVGPRQTLIVEDSKVGKEAVWNSGAYLMPVESPQDLTEKNFCKYLWNKKFPCQPYSSSKLSVVIPMAGAGNRFAERGYRKPKPLIDVFKKPMIQCVVDNLNIDAEHVFICQKEHIKKYQLDTILPLIKPGCHIVKVEEMTKGAACTVKLAEKVVNKNNRLLIVNCDQLIKWNNQIIDEFIENKIDGAILTFKSTHPKWSYAKVGKNGYVSSVAEKKVISNNATSGHYYWKLAGDFFSYADKMIEKNITTNNEFYVAPVYNEAIQDGKKIIVSEIENMYGLGTPKDLQEYLSKTPLKVHEKLQK